MSRIQTLLALAAVISASIAALQVPGRLIFAAIAVALLIAVAGARLRAALVEKREPPSGFDAAERARQIREDRRRRLGG
ncbi:MAG TPA: hypothetical protein VGG89_09555 [Candidatus Baltobacteraceae bacterium]|jgi:hypothetical protein